MIYSDEELLEAIRGDHMQSRNAALKQLYFDDVVVGKVKALIANYQAHQVEPKEVIQEGLILLNDSVREGRFHGKSKVRTFLIGICVNLIRSRGKKIDRITFAKAPEDMPDYDEAEQSPEGYMLLEEKNEEITTRNELLMEILKELTEKCRKVLHLYYFLAQSMAQIAENRGLKNADQAKKAAKRCRHQLRDRLKKQPQLAEFLKQSL